MNQNDANRSKLQALVDLFNLSLADIAKTVGCSRPLVSRVLHGDLDGQNLWGKLERCLPEMISKRGQAFFEVEAVSVEKVLDVVERLKKVA